VGLAGPAQRSRDTPSPHTTLLEERRWVGEAVGSQPRIHFLSAFNANPGSPQAPTTQDLAKLIERCSDGGEDQGAEEALWGNRESFFVSFGSRLPCERLSFQAVDTAEVQCR